jgi:hypothetical protein
MYNHIVYGDARVKRITPVIKEGRNSVMIANKLADPLIDGQSG